VLFEILESSFTVLYRRLDCRTLERPFARLGLLLVMTRVFFEQMHYRCNGIALRVRDELIATVGVYRAKEAFLAQGNISLSTSNSICSNSHLHCLISGAMHFFTSFSHSLYVNS
jgi:hypothetical protein